MKRTICIFIMIVLLAAGLSVGSSKAANAQSDNREKTEQTVSREGFSIREISDDLFDRMRGGKT